jgi:RNA polymerase sigma-70 factor (ECF subfamily)
MSRSVPSKSHGFPRVNDTHSGPARSKRADPDENEGPARSKRADPDENEGPARSKRADPNENELEHRLGAVHGRVVAALVRRFGVDRLALVEDGLQEASLRVLGVEADLGGAGELESWLLRVAGNWIIDRLRQERRSASITEAPTGRVDPLTMEVDDELRLVFLCCHPRLARAAQVALTLRTAFGFTTAQIARTFLADERTIAQRIVRAKRQLREARVKFELPGADELPERRDAILEVLYQVFTEGHSATEGEMGLDVVICNESLRLVRLLTDDDRLGSPPAEALRAVFCFHLSRVPARHADDGSLLLLQEQDRARWDTGLIAEGFEWLARSARGGALSRFHAEAGIAACHAAPTYASTDWSTILELYEVLRGLVPSPVVDVNRAWAVAMCRGATPGLDELDAIPERDLLARYPYALAVYAELHASLGDLDRARAYLDRALDQRMSAAERALLLRKRASLGT